MMILKSGLLFWATLYTGWPKKQAAIKNHHHIVLKPSARLKFSTILITN